MKQTAIKTFQVSKKPSVLLLSVPYSMRLQDTLTCQLGDILRRRAADFAVTAQQRDNNPVAELPDLRQKPIKSNDDPTARYLEMVANGHPLPPIIACLAKCGGNRLVNDDEAQPLSELSDDFGIELADGNARISCIREMERRAIPVPSNCKSLTMMLYCGMSWVERAKLSLRLRPHRVLPQAGSESVELACVFGEHIAAELATNADSPLRGTISPFGPFSASCLADTIAYFGLSNGRMKKMLADDDVGGAVETIALYLQSVAIAAGINWQEPDFDPEAAFTRCLSAMREIDDKISNNFRRHHDIFVKHGKSIIYDECNIAKLVTGSA